MVKVVVILKLADKYETKYGKQLKPETYGYKSVFDIVKSLKENAVVFYHDMLHLWVAKYQDTVAPGDGIVVDEVGDEDRDTMNGNGDHEKSYDIDLTTQGDEDFEVCKNLNTLSLCYHVWSFCTSKWVNIGFSGDIYCGI